MRGDARLGAVRLLLVLTLAILSRAGPVNRPTLENENDSLSQITELKSTNINEVSGCIFGAKKYILGQTVPSIKRCEICVCTENGIQCSAEPCEVKQGCKALHRADNCCPLYQCECERNGVTYSNGEKLIDPENPCQVCYCQGGDIVCNQIACFIKNDCEPRYVPGRCCPEYDHCPPREKLISNSSKPEPQSFDIKIDYETSSESISFHDIGDITIQEIPYSGDRMNDDANIEDSFGYSTGLPAEYPSIKKENILNVHIKEVTYDKPLNNEIRIKEILPVISYDINSLPTKSPTYPREASQSTHSSKEVETYAEVKNYTESENVEAYQTPPILRIGDKLLYLGQGDLVPENSSLNTPAPVFTVIGAEGLQRVIEDPEEFDSRFVSEENQDDIRDNSIDKKISSASFPEKSTENDSLANSSVEEEITTTSEDPEKILQEVISDLYETTTVESSNELKKNFNQKESKIEPNSSELGSGDSINPEQLPPSFENESQPVPIDHLPEHNPEYPPIPEDIDFVPEDTSEPISSEMDLTGTYPIANQEVRNNDKKEIVKRPHSPSQTLSSSAREKSPKDSEKIIPEVLQFVRENKTESSENSTTHVPQEWLKVPNSSENANVNTHLETIVIKNVSLSTIFKESTEEDDSQDYIFINNPNQEPSSNAHVRKDPFTGIYKDKTESKNSLRSPGEPLLVPEWERNHTIDTTDSESNVGPDLIIELNGNQTEILSNDTILINVSFEKEEEEKLEKALGVTEKNDPTESQNIIVTEVSSTENVITRDPKFPLNSEEFAIDENNNSSNVIEMNNDESADIFSGDFADNTISPTKNSILSSSTESIISVHKPENGEIPDTFVLNENVSSDSYNQKQKKAPILLSDSKKENSGKKGNILADLISLVGDVASIGDHDAELSTVHNSIDNDHEKYTHSFEKSTAAPISSTEGNKIYTDSGFNSAKVEITEESINDKTDVPLESDKVEFTTKKTYIDHDSDERIKWKSTDSINKDIEIIPKVETKVTRFPEKIIDKEESEESYSYELGSSEDIFKPKEVLLILTQTDPEPSTTTNAPKITTIKATTTTTSAPKITTTKTTTTTTSAPKIVTTTTSAPKIVTTTVRPTTTEKAVSNESKIETADKKAEIKPPSSAPASNESSEKASPTVMKLSTKNDPNKDEGKSGDKLTKRETNSQIVETTGQIDESLITILRDFFEKQYRH